MVLLMPQGDVGNPTNCWDGSFPGYTGTDNWSHDGVQVKAIKNMIQRMKEPKGADLSLLSAETWEMPPGYYDVNGWFEEAAWYGKIPQIYRNLQNLGDRKSVV